MDRYFKRDGTPYGGGKNACLRWAKDMNDKKLRRVKEDTLSNGLYISTVWLGLNHSFNPKGKPKIFETMVFDKSNQSKSKKFSKLFSLDSSLGEDLDQMRWSTEGEALAGHYLMVKKWSSWRGFKLFRKYFTYKGVKTI